MAAKIRAFCARRFRRHIASDFFLSNAAAAGRCRDESSSKCERQESDVCGKCRATPPRGKSRCPPLVEVRTPPDNHSEDQSTTVQVSCGNFVSAGRRICPVTL